MRGFSWLKKSVCIAYPPHAVGFDTMVPFRWNVEDSSGFKCNLLHSVTLTMHIFHSQLSLLETKHVESGAQLSKITFMFIFLCRDVATRVQQEHLSLTMKRYNKSCWKIEVNRRMHHTTTITKSACIVPFAQE